MQIRLPQIPDTCLAWGTRFLLLLPAVLFLTGCVSTQDRYEKAVLLEGQGRYEDAATYYIKVLRKDPAWPEAKERLRETGNHVVNESLDHTHALVEVEDFEGAVGVLARLDRLREQAANVGVLLPVPDNYDAYRQDLTEGAIMSLIRQGERAEAERRWQTALEAYERALTGYSLSLETQEELQASMGRVLIRWGEDDMARQHFRSAYGRAARALEIIDTDAAMAEHALALQHEALQAGTQHVVFLPVASARLSTGSVPESFLPNLNEVFRYEYWDQTPLFIASADPADVYRELRRYGLERRPVSRNDAVNLGRTLGADLVVINELDELNREETVVREQVRRVRTRGRNPVDTSYVEQVVDVTLEARIAFQVVDPVTRDVVYQNTVQASVEDRIEQGIYEGDARNLDLSSSARRLFDSEVQEEERLALEAALTDALAEDAAWRVYDVLLSGIR
jgi:tetratricopeptide (TPR) repeat protein